MFYKSITFLTSLPIPLLPCLREINEDSKNSPLLDIPLASNASGVIKSSSPTIMMLGMLSIKSIAVFLTAPPRTTSNPFFQ